MEKLTFSFKKPRDERRRPPEIPIRPGASTTRDDPDCRPISLKRTKFYVRVRMEKYGIHWKLVLKQGMLYLTSEAPEELTKKYDHKYVSIFIEYIHRIHTGSDLISENRISMFPNSSPSFDHTIDKLLAARMWRFTGRTALRRVVIHMKIIEKWESYNAFESIFHRGADAMIKLNGKELFVHSQIVGAHSASFLRVFQEEEDLGDPAISEYYDDNERRLKCCDVTWEEEPFLNFLRYMYGDDFMFNKENLASFIETSIRFKGKYHITRIEQYIGSSGMTLLQKVSIAWKYKLISLLVNLTHIKEFPALMTLFPKTEFFSTLDFDEKEKLLSYLSSRRYRSDIHYTIEFTIPAAPDDEDVVFSNQVEHFDFEWYLRVVKEGNRFAYNLCCYSMDKDSTDMYEIYKYQVQVGVTIDGQYMVLELSNMAEAFMFNDFSRTRRPSLVVDFKSVTILMYEVAPHLPITTLNTPAHGLRDSEIKIEDMTLFAYSQVLKLYSPQLNNLLKKNVEDRHFLTLNPAPQTPMEVLFSILTLPAVIHRISTVFLEKLFIHSGFINKRSIGMRIIYRCPVVIFAFDLRIVEKHLAFLIQVGNVKPESVRSSITLGEYKKLNRMQRARADSLLNDGEKMYT
ncbi:unnamed protein product [Auanema sp. JU1783]|nr:unnamed protein product [Auanema sp. JU1783]